MISYKAEGVRIPHIKKRNTTAWIRHIATTYGKHVGDVGFLFVDDERMLRVNKTYLQHDYYTDVITFDYSEGNSISGDIFISLDTVKSNAEKFHTPFMEELHRVIIHGILHLCGFNDKSSSERQTMREEEDKALRLL